MDSKNAPYVSWIIVTSLVVYLICRHYYRTICNFFLTLSIAVPFIRDTLTPTRTGGHMVRCDRPVLVILRNTKRVVQNPQAQRQSLDLQGKGSSASGSIEESNLNNLMRPLALDVNSLFRVAVIAVRPSRDPGEVVAPFGSNSRGRQIECRRTQTLETWQGRENAHSGRGSEDWR